MPIIRNAKIQTIIGSERLSSGEVRSPLILMIESIDYEKLDLPTKGDIRIEIIDNIKIERNKIEKYKKRPKYE